MFYTQIIDYTCSAKGIYDLSSLQALVRTKLAGKCSQEKGFYSNIADVVIVSMRASPNGGLICTARVQVEFYKPAENERAYSTIKKIDKTKGIVCAYSGMNLLVPAREIAAGKEIKEGDLLELEIIKVRYQIGRFTAVARFIQNK